MARDPFRFFRIEARELHEKLGKGVLDLEKGGATPEPVTLLLRLAHTLKGAARVVKQPGIAEQAHAIEDVLAPLREGAQLTPDITNTLLTTVDRIGALVEEIPPPSGEGQPSQDARKPDPRPAQVQVPRPAEPLESPGLYEDVSRQLRSDVEELDALLDGVTEASVQLSGLSRGVEALDRIGRLAAQLADHLGNSRGRVMQNGEASAIRSLADEVGRHIGSLQLHLPKGIELVGRELRSVRECAERLRLLPASAMFNILERTARDAAHSLGHRVEFNAAGGDVRLDGQVLGVVQNALVQAVRNAVAHGIESPAERSANGKPPAGRITLDIARRGNRVRIRCQDDGRGINLDAVRRVVERRTGQPAAALSDEEVMNRLLQGGISTADTVTEVAGRGVGLDVVSDAARRLGGKVSIRTDTVLGTTIEMDVPLTLSSLEALVAQGGDQTVAIPLDAVRGLARHTADDLTRSDNGKSVLYEGQLIPFNTLASVLGAKVGRSDGQSAFTTIVIEAGAALAAVGVDHLLGTESLVWRPLPALTPADPVVAGVYLDGEGNPRIVVDPETLNHAPSTGHLDDQAAAERPAILVIDDSMTTRMLEQSILESEGYQVDVAASAEEGMDKAQAKPYALILCDVEMPGKNGFEFIEWLRAHSTLRRTPAFLVTSRDAPEDRRRGSSVGATAYIVKSEFNQIELLEHIRRLVG